VRVLVCGGRDFNDVDLMYDILKEYNISVLITGHAKGADQMAEMWADEHRIENEIYPAQWDKYGRAAGPIRNKQMLDEGEPDLVIAFPGGKGTANMVNQAKERGIPVNIVNRSGCQST
jgi:UDP-N-acetylmuramoylalanine-D-glutamate ligase